MTEVMEESNEKNNYFILMGEPLPHMTPGQWVKIHHDCETEHDLANAFAGASNEADWLADETYDEDCSAETIERYRKWYKLTHELEKKIRILFEQENPKGKRKVPFRKFVVSMMQRNGYVDGNGWWIPVKERK